MKKILKWGGIIFAIFIVVSLIGSTGENNSVQPTNEESSTEKSAVDSMGALEQAEIAFIGNPPQEEIREKMDRALQLYNTEITEENYSRAGSALVALRKESKTGVTEMEILNYMIRSHAEGVKMSFPDMAAISFSALESERNKSN